jgi:hypothetical protein
MSYYGISVAWSRVILSSPFRHWAILFTIEQTFFCRLERSPSRVRTPSSDIRYYVVICHMHRANIFPSPLSDPIVEYERHRAILPSSKHFFLLLWAIFVEYERLRAINQHDRRYRRTTAPQNTRVGSCPIHLTALSSLSSSWKKNQNLLEEEALIKWEYRVYAYLELLDLEDLVSDLPRPNRNAPSYTKWRKHSKMVRTWLISTIHNDLLDDIIYCRERLEYADEFLRKIKMIFVGSYARDHIH